MDVIQQLQATQQVTMQQLQAMQGAIPPVPPPPPPPPPPAPAAEAPAAEGTAMVDENAWWYQGPRTCRKCGQKAYLRQGVCYNMECVTCLINWSGLFLGLQGGDSFMMSFCFFNGLRH